MRQKRGATTRTSANILPNGRRRSVNCRPTVSSAMSASRDRRPKADSLDTARSCPTGRTSRAGPRARASVLRNSAHRVLADGLRTPDCRT